jgi:LEA14-like dessication related protein
MRIVIRLLPLLALAAICLALPACRPLIKGVFQTPKVKLVDVAIAGNPFVAPSGLVGAVLHLRVTNPNSYGLTLVSVAYTAAIASETVADGERNEETLIEPSGDTLVHVPVTLRADAFASALKQVLRARTIPYEFNGSVGMVAPVVGTVRVPFTKSGTIDPADILRKKGIGFN